MEEELAIHNVSDLHLTVKNETKAKILDSLQCADSVLKITDDEGNTVLHSVLANQKLMDNEILDIVNIFLDRGVDPNIKNEKHETALHLAVARRLREVIVTLINHNAEINTTDCNGNFITHYFIEDEFKKIRSILHFLNLNIEKIEEESMNFVEWLIDRGFDFGVKNALGISALQFTINYRLLHILPILLKKTKYVRYLFDEYKMLFPSLTSDRPRVNSYYERHAFRIMKIVLDESSHTLIQSDEDVQFFEELINRLSETGNKNDCATSLFHALVRSCEWWSRKTTECHLQILHDLIVSFHVDINAPYDRGLRPIFSVVGGKNLRALEFFEENGADFTVKTSNGQNLLAHLVVNSRPGNQYSEAACKYLIIKGCDVNGKDKNGTRPLHLAAELIGIAYTRIVTMREICVTTYVDNPNVMIKLLSKHGGYVNARNADGRTPLCRAVMKRVSANVEELLEWGADINEKCIIDLQPWNESDVRLRDLLMRHWIKLKAAGLPCSSEYEVHVEDEGSRRFHEECLNEVEILKAIFVDDRTTLHRVLRLDPNRRSVYVNDVKLGNVVYSTVLEKQFPLYWTVIMANHREAVLRKSLMQPAKDGWLRLTEIYLPDICVERILDYLSNADLVELGEEDGVEADDADLKRKVPRIA